MTDSERDGGLDAARKLKSAGGTMADLIRELHSHDLTIIQSMRFLVQECGVSLAEAKVLVSNHPVWSEIVQASEPLKDEIVDTNCGHQLGDTNWDTQ